MNAMVQLSLVAMDYIIIVDGAILPSNHILHSSRKGRQHFVSSRRRSFGKRKVLSLLTNQQNTTAHSTSHQHERV